jgi:hypothetical protein
LKKRLLKGKLPNYGRAMTKFQLSEPARVFSVLATNRGRPPPPVNFQAGMQQPGILRPAEADSTSIGRRRFTEIPHRSEMSQFVLEKFRRRGEVAGSRQSGYNSVVMVAHTAPGALLISEPTDTRVWPWG